MTILSVLRPPPAPAADVISGTAVLPEVYVDGQLMDLVGVPSLTRGRSADQTAKLRVSLSPPSMGAEAFYDADGEPLKGTNSPQVEIYATTMKDGRRRRFIGWVSDYSHKPGTGFAEFDLVGDTAQPEVLAGDLENLASDVSEWTAVNATTETTDSPGTTAGRRVTHGPLKPDVDISGIHDATILPDLGRTYIATWTAWVRRDPKHRPTGHISFALRNPATHHVDWHDIDISGLPRGVWKRVGPDTYTVISGVSYEHHAAVFAPPADQGYVDVADVQLRLDPQVGVGPGQDDADLACVIWQEWAYAAGSPWAVSKDAPGLTVYDQDEKFPIRERSDPRASLPPGIEWLVDPDARRIRVAGRGGLGALRTDLLAGWPTGDFIVTQIESGSDGMFNVVYEEGPWGDATNEEAIATVSARRTFRMAETAQTGALPKQLQGYADTTASVVSRGKSARYTMVATTPEGGRSPVEWLGDIEPCDALLARIVEGPADINGTPRVATVEVNFDAQTFTITADSELAA